jgi:hypothetical protein
MSCAPVRSWGLSWLSFAFALLTLGCAGDPTLYIAGPTTGPVGEVSGYMLSINAKCGGKPFGGPADPVPLVCPKVPHLAEVIEAACDNGACTIDSISPPDQDGFIAVGVVGSQSGDTTLRVRARGADGAELSSTLPVTFVVATGLHVVCDGTLIGQASMMRPAGQCGGHYPVFTDSSWRWRLAFTSAAGDLIALSVTANVSGDGSVTASLAGSNLVLRSSSSPGMVDVQVSSRQFMKSVPVRVVSPADVVMGELQIVSDAVPNDGIDQDITTLGPAPNTLWYGDSKHRIFDGDTGNMSIQPVLKLTDGSTAFGGGGLFVSDHPDVARLFGVSGGGTQLQQTSLQITVAGVGNATASATIGSAQLTWPIQVISRLGI